MSSTRKPRSDSTLKTLSEERQMAIVEYLRDHSQPETVSWLRADGLRTSVTALSEFYSWFQLRQQLKRNESTVETLLKELAKKNTALDPAQIQELGQTFFTALSLEQQDVKGWFLTQQLRIKDQQLGLDRERFEFLKRKAEQADRAEEVVGSQATPEEKQQKLRAIFGMSS